MIEVVIRSALGSDLEDIRRCTKMAYSKYIERLNREPAPMHADFSTLIARGCVDIAMFKNTFAGYVVFYYQGDHAHLENVAVLPASSVKLVGT